MGADVNAHDSEGRTPLHEAILRGHVPIVEMLLKNGANVHYKTRIGECPLMTAVHCDDPTAIELLKKCGAHFTSADCKQIAEVVNLAARNGAVRRLESLKLAGADLNIRDELHQTPMHKAVLCNCTEVAYYLITNGYDTDQPDVLGNTPKDYAEILNREALLEVLRKNV